MCYIWGNQLLFQLCCVNLVWLFDQKTFKKLRMLLKNQHFLRGANIVHDYAWLQLKVSCKYLFFFCSHWLCWFWPHKSRKIRLTRAPETLKELNNELRQKHALVGEFCIQHEDSDFGWAVCNLIDMPSPPPPTPPWSSSICTLDTVSIGSPDSIHSLSSLVRAYTVVGMFHSGRLCSQSFTDTPQGE